VKKIDKLLIQSFIGPFFVTFLIAIFVLMMQTLWLYVDDIVGKGAGLFLLIELLSYMTVSLVPMALPIAVLISSVMVMGNLAEHYELSSFKSAGVSLPRVMRPLIFIAFGISILSFFVNDSLIPISNLKFKSRLHDIRKQKPTLSIEEGLFNDDFGDIIIRVDKKVDEDGTVEKVLIYDHSSSNENRMSQINAERGRMYTTNEGKYFVMDLEDGSQFNEVKPDFKDGKRNYPFVRTQFKTWSKVFDMSSFEISGTDEELFKSHHTMLSSRQLSDALDSIDVDLGRRKGNFSEYVARYISVLEQPEPKNSKKEEEEEEIPVTKGSAKKPKKKTKGFKYTGSNIPKTVASNTFKPAQQFIEKDLKEYNSIAELFYKDETLKYFDKSKTFIRAILTQAESTQNRVERIAEKRVKHLYELHFKFSLAASCLIFLFIGAPMGAIVRKGGFGYPILISIVFFMIFITLNIMCKKLAESHTLPTILAAWLPCLVLLPVGIFLTTKAMNDSQIFEGISLDRIRSIFQKTKPAE